MDLPFREIGTIRIFSQDTSEDEFVWHRDREDRIISSEHPTDWKFQIDNEFPQEITTKELFIGKGTYHRLIKGTGDLHLKVIKLT